jgi:hypothetical protein
MIDLIGKKRFMIFSTIADPLLKNPKKSIVDFEAS